jgi:hypothetical protein
VSKLIPVESVIRWLDSVTKLPADEDYNRGYNDAVLDLRNALSKTINRNESLNNDDGQRHPTTAG